MGEVLQEIDAEAQELEPRHVFNEQLRCQVDTGLRFNSREAWRDALQKDIAEYEMLKKGDIQSLELESFEQLPEALIKARIIRGLTQAQLAEKLNVMPQQVQRDEATGYIGASFRKILRIQEVLGIEVKQEIIFK